MKTVKIELYYSEEYQVEDTSPEALDHLEQLFCESLDSFIILDRLDTTVTESEGN